MATVRRPIQLQIKPASTGQAAGPRLRLRAGPGGASLPSPLSPTGDLLPSQIIPNLFVGNQQQTNRDTLNRLNISYILSLGLLPLVSANLSPSSPGSTLPAAAGATLLPDQNSSREFKIRLRTNAHEQQLTPTKTPSSPSQVRRHQNNQDARDENKSLRPIRFIQCKCINIADNHQQILSKFFDEAHQFIDEARRKKCNILVHCLAGISRSPTVAIAYLMKVNSLRLQDAYNLVKQCRPQIDPNLSFIGQLREYEKSLDESRITKAYLDTNQTIVSTIGHNGTSNITIATNSIQNNSNSNANKFSPS